MAKWIRDVKHNPDTDEHYIELNDEILEGSGFKIGDSLKWTDNKDGSYTLAKAPDDTDIYVVNTISSFNIRYAVRAKSYQDAMDYVSHKIESDGLNITELHQQHQGEIVRDAKKISKKEYLKRFDELNDYLKGWTKEQKLNMINEVDYEDDE